MTDSQHAFLMGLIDYAGLFPPAALDLDAALATYTRARSGPEAWMLSRFIAPVGRLDDIRADLDTARSSAPISLSVLGHAPAKSTSWIDLATQTVAEAQRVEAASDRGVRCDRFEIRLPVELASDPDALARALVDLDAALHAPDRPAARVALEVPLLDAPETVEPTAQGIADANGRAKRPAFAIKLRCGGVTADLFPSVEALARALAGTLRAGIPFKATAGLHHPVRQYRDEVDTQMHGFLNVFGGAILARRHRLDADALADILDDTDPAHFGLDESLRWTSLSASAVDIADARARFALSYGSCSFDEPLDDLRQFGWLDPVSETAEST